MTGSDSADDSADNLKLVVHAGAVGSICSNREQPHEVLVGGCHFNMSTREPIS